MIIVKKLSTKLYPAHILRLGWDTTESIPELINVWGVKYNPPPLSLSVCVCVCLDVCDKALVKEYCIINTTSWWLMEGLIYGKWPLMVGYVFSDQSVHFSTTYYVYKENKHQEVYTTCTNIVRCVGHVCKQASPRARAHTHTHTYIYIYIYI